MTPTDELKWLQSSLPVRGVKVVYKKDSWFWRVLAWLVLVVTFGKNKTFLDNYVTTIGHTIALPSTYDQWDDLSKLELFTHELKHVAQCERYTTFLWGLSYVLLPLPMGFAWFRYLYEREAYLAGFLKVIQYAPQARQLLVDHGVAQLTGPNYGWTWIFKKSVAKWFDDRLPR